MSDLYTKGVDSVSYDNLFAGPGIPVLNKPVVLAAGQGILARGTVLGKSPVDEKYYKVNSAAEPMVKRTLQITGTTTKTATLSKAGLTTTGLKVYIGDEHGDLATITTDYTVDYTTPTLTITVVGAGALASVAQIYVEANKAAAGADVADCILTDAVDTGSDDDVVAVAYSSGLFNRLALIFGGTDTAADHEDELRALGIFLKDNVPY